MSLIGHVYLLPSAKIEQLLAGSLDVFEVIDRAYNDPAQGFVDLDKAWHCLHYLLSGSARGGEGPRSFLLQGGAPVGDEALSEIGPARVFSAAEVSVIADALASVTRHSLLTRLDPKKLEKLDIYPGRWSELNLGSDYDLGYYFGPFEELKHVLERGKTQGLGMIVWIS